MTDSEKMDLILANMQSMREELTTDMQNMRKELTTDMQSMREELTTDMQNMREELTTNMDNMHEELSTSIHKLQEDVTNIKMTMENEIRVNIQRVAEGHLDLSRNMHEVMKPNNEIEMMAIKINVLESEVRDIKRKIS